MNKLKQLSIYFGVFAIAYLLSSSLAVSGKASDTVEGYEENEFLAGLDLWINQTTSAPSQFASYQNGMETVGQEWELQRYFLLPESVNLDDWIILDSDAIFVIGGFGGIDLSKQQPSLIGSYAGEEKTETGLTGFAGRDVDDFANVDANDKVAQIDEINAPITNFEYTGLNLSGSDTDGFASANYKANYTVPENKAEVGVRYIATDRKTIWEYAEDTADEEGRTLQAIVNASIVNYIMKGAFEDMEAVIWGFEEVSSSTSGLQPNGIGSITKRATTWIHAKKDSASRSLTGVRKSITDTSLFKSVSKLPSGIAGLPSRAGHFVTKTIPSGFHKVGNVVMGAFSGGLKNMGKALLIGALLIIGLILLMNYRKTGKWKLR